MWRRIWGCSGYGPRPAGSIRNGFGAGHWLPDIRIGRRTGCWTETVSACLACFDADVAAGRDAYLRANWRLAEQVVCPAHRTDASGSLPRVSRSACGFRFRMLNGLLRPFCRKCDAVLTGGGGETEDPLKADFAAGVLDLQRQISEIIRGDPSRLDRTRACNSYPRGRRSIATGLARPVLALWYDEPGWNCPFEARSAVGRPAPLQHLSVRWRDSDIGDPA